MNKQEIKEKIKQLETEINIYEKEQHSLKILLNAGYGACANTYFIFYDIRLAKAITYTSQLVIKWIINYISKKLSIIEIVYSDTDSADENTIIKSKKYGDIKIKDYFNIISGIEEYKSLNNIVKYSIENDEVLSYSNKEEFKKCNYVMKHKVKKRMFKIKVNNNEVIVTEDHSIIVERNNKIISVKPQELNKNIDKVIMIIN